MNSKSIMDSDDPSRLTCLEEFDDSVEKGNCLCAPRATARETGCFQGTVGTRSSLYIQSGSRMVLTCSKYHVCSIRAIG